MSASPFVITYFPVRGRAELARLICEEAKLPYKNNFIFGDALAALKPELAFGQVPYLTREGQDSVKLVQSIAIARFLAREANLVPSNPLDAARCDMIVDGAGDLYSAWGTAYWVPKDQREAKLQEFKTSKLEFFLQKFEQLLTQNGGQFFVTKNALSWADLAVYNVLEHLQFFESNKNYLEKYTNLHAFFNAIANRPNLKAYIESKDRPTIYTGA